MMKLGVLTSGGDAPGMNAAIRAVVKTADYHNIEVMGIEGGYQGLIEGKLHRLTSTNVDYIADKGGTFLKTSRCPEFMEESGRIKALRILKSDGINHLVVIGGEGSFKGAQKLHELGVNVIAIPATIDNDLSYTDYSIGFDTTLNTILECLGKIKDTDLSHDKTTIVEVMGRYCGDLALYSALAGAGEIISTPERKLGFEEICFKLNEKIKNGKKDNLILITEKMYDIQDLQKYVEDRLDISVRTSILGFIQRGGQPSAFDRILASKMGITAVELLLKGYSGRAVGIKENDLINVDIEKVHSKLASNDDKYSLLDTILA
ncbi:6-phosphofructokinase [Priestia aryabhattai]|uniref:6-phosphofructokinase n=1 Tax=Priestia TaxID=2800373 RepID=UPI0008DDF275|nr:6-phosphofructokinase [Priestia aryabhattai]MBZ6484259.1 6-phosphofructokinase [Priestia aryabhattai]MDH3115360.1 6-phosphofructokinase [Priestia aryabhattai]MDH3125749.1 6-phosphofructokinase [Priestia aryabhattai]MDH3134035.1 6-phosphofructokinase [Priestia aryabhattai]MED4154870.1 6-phosphofructokinase [Priestia aryabhattai]